MLTDFETTHAILSSTLSTGLNSDVYRFTAMLTSSLIFREWADILSPEPIFQVIHRHVNLDSKPLY